MLFIVIKLPSLFEPHWYGDEGVYSAVAHQIRNGESIYSSVWDNKLPGIYYIFLVASFFGNTLFSVRLFNLIALGLTVFIINSISKKLFGAGVKTKLITVVSAVLLSLPILETNIANAENFFILFTTFAIFQILNKKYALAGLSYGVAIVFKIHPAVELAAITLLITVNVLRNKNNKIHLQNAIKLIAFGSLPIILLSLIFVFGNNLTSFIQEALIGNFTYVSEKMNLFNFIFFENSLIIRLGILVIVLLYIYYKYYRNLISFEKSLIYVWLVAGLFAAVISDRGYPHYLLQVLPAFTISIFIYIFERKISLKVFEKLALVALMIFGYMSLFLQGRIFIKYLDYSKYYPNFIELITNVKSKGDYNLYFNNESQKLYDLVNYVKVNNYENKYVYYADNNAWFYELANVKSPSKYITWYHLFMAKDRKANLINEFKTKKPELIIINKDFDIFKELQSYLVNYEEADQMHEYIIYKTID